MKHIILFILTNITFSNLLSNPIIIFQNNDIKIVTDTNVLFQLIRENYKESNSNYEEEIIHEIKYRIKNAHNDSIYMDGMNLDIYQNIKRTSRIVSGLNYNEVYQLIKQKKCRIYWLENGLQIKKYKTKKKGSKKKGFIEKIYIDKSNNKVFLRRTIYHKVCSGPPRF